MESEYVWVYLLVYLAVLFFQKKIKISDDTTSRLSMVVYRDSVISHRPKKFITRKKVVLMQDWKFENDAGCNPQMKLARQYVEHWAEMQKKNTGLLIWGGVGTGKSFFAGCIANALMEQEIPVCMTNFARILNELNNSFSGRNEVVDRLCRYPLLIIDDFGIKISREKSPGFKSFMMLPCRAVL